MMPRILNDYSSSISKQMLAKYTYILEVPFSLQNGKEDEVISYIEGTKTKVKNAEKFTAYSLKTTTGYKEDVSLYGVKDHSRYIHHHFLKNDVLVSRAYAQKCHLKKGSSLTLKEPYKNKTYHFKVTGVYPYDGAISLFMSQSKLEKMFDLSDHFDDDIDQSQVDSLNRILRFLDDTGIEQISNENMTYVQLLTGPLTKSEQAMINDLLKNHIRDINTLLDFHYFTGYFSNAKLTDLNEKYVGQVIDYHSLNALANQLMHSMGDFMSILTVASFLIYLILMYLLVKIMIDKNALSISLTKILGFNNKEMILLYLMPIAFCVIVFEIITLLLDNYLLDVVWNMVVAMEMSGYLGYQGSPIVLVELFVSGMILMFVLGLIEYRYIKKIPMDMVLKEYV